MEYISAKEAASKWGISVRRVQALCKKGRIHGLFRFGDVWAIPQDIEKPIDGRTKAAKESQKSVENDETRFTQTR